MHREVLDNELLEIRGMLLAMARLVREALGRSVTVLKSRDIAGCEKVIADDEAVNELRCGLEEACLTLIATQQPVAGDLRWLLSVLEIATELERIGDYAKGNARISILIGDRPLVKPLTNIPVMCGHVSKMLDDAISAFIENDTEKALEVAGRDSFIDDLHHQTQRELLTFIMENPRILGGALYLTWVSHNFERTGDRIVNICERIVFTATGRFADL